MWRAHIFITPETKRKQLTANDATRLITNAIICYSKQPLVHKSLRDLFCSNSLKCWNYFFAKQFCKFHIWTLVNPVAGLFFLHIYNIRVTINKMKYKEVQKTNFLIRNTKMIEWKRREVNFSIIVPCPKIHSELDFANLSSDIISSCAISRYTIQRFTN